jgi:hypothetical protein
MNFRLKWTPGIGRYFLLARWHPDVENSCEMAAAMGCMHERMKQIGFLALSTGTLVIMMVVGQLHYRRRIMARFMHIANGREHRIHQHGQHQHCQRGSAQHFDKTAAEESRHERGMLAERVPVKQSHGAYSGYSVAGDALLDASNERKEPSPMTKPPDQPAQVH